ncbi:hypothetical protein CABS01_08886 [Colletotrichum abscissum]|uniref:Mitochondrial distribution and morphology protein 35 n=6 Tax=Colletotrichum TaxID=5455 RepID=A0A9Q0ASM5_9PEZI|nr:uncharacterized protein CABS01_08886 [Colletotrichum abscissum]KAI3527431.1 hypothetical protein CABS02_15374 [Colletotrichum abscissum]KAK1505108.1 hypothetical protein CABS01_08886 [Colletotrichum abscissum]
MTPLTLGTQAPVMILSPFLAATYNFTSQSSVRSVNREASIMSASLAPECNEVKERYDTCFLKWYSEKYLRGTGTDNNECADLFKNYQKCLTVALKERGIDKLLDEAREDQKDNDATYMGRKCECRISMHPPHCCNVFVEMRI